MAVPELAPLELKRRLDGGEAVLVLDVREPWECAIASLPGSRNIPLGQINTRWQELDPAADVVVMCKAGGRSRMAAEFLQRQGFGKVANLAGGIDAWAQQVDPSLSTY